MKSLALIPVAWVHRILSRGPGAVRKGALTSLIVTDEQKINASAKTRVELFRKLDML